MKIPVSEKKDHIWGALDSCLIRKGRAAMGGPAFNCFRGGLVFGNPLELLFNGLKLLFQGLGPEAQVLFGDRGSRSGGIRSWGSRGGPAASPAPAKSAAAAPAPAESTAKAVALAHSRAKTLTGGGGFCYTSAHFSSCHGPHILRASLV
jgi:hypothetical protein